MCEKCGIAHGGWRVVVWLVYRWQLARPLFGVRLCSVYLCLVSAQCVCAWCAANDYLSIAQFETVIGLHPTIYIVTWCWPWWGHILTWEGLIAFWEYSEGYWSTFSSSEEFLLKNMRQTVWQFFFHKTVEVQWTFLSNIKFLCQHCTNTNTQNESWEQLTQVAVTKCTKSYLTRSFHLPTYLAIDKMTAIYFAS